MPLSPSSISAMVELVLADHFLETFFDVYLHKDIYNVLAQYIKTVNIYSY